MHLFGLYDIWGFLWVELQLLQILAQNCRWRLGSQPMQYGQSTARLSQHHVTAGSFFKNLIHVAKSISSMDNIRQHRCTPRNEGTKLGSEGIRVEEACARPALAEFSRYGAKSRHVNRKIDIALLPFLSTLYLFNGLDRSNVGNAETQGKLHITVREKSLAAEYMLQVSAQRWELRPTTSI